MAVSVPATTSGACVVAELRPKNPHEYSCDANHIELRLQVRPHLGEDVPREYRQHHGPTQWCHQSLQCTIYTQGYYVGVTQLQATYLRGLKGRTISCRRRFRLAILAATTERCHRNSPLTVSHTRAHPWLSSTEQVFRVARKPFQIGVL